MIFASNDWLVPALIAVVVITLVCLNWLKKSIQYPYEKIDSLATKTELKFFHVLKAVVSDRFVIFGKVRIADLLKVTSGSKNRMSWQNKINCKHIDFVLCDPESLNILVAVELDDRSHQREDRIKRDEFVNKAFEDANLPILRVKTKKEYDVKALTKAIDLAVNPKDKNWVYHIE